MMSDMPSHQDLSKRIQYSLESIIKYGVPDGHSKEIYEYALFPAGKLFRPLLAHSLALDLNPDNWNGTKVWKDLTNQDLFSAALEIHHVYTLCHDDLPSMDNDEWRRGKSSVHKAYTPWKALLIGDGLINLSYEALWLLNHPNAQTVGRYFSHKLGPHGLIHGQYKDLSQEMKKSFSDLYETHILKTAHLIEVSLVGALYLSHNEVPKETAVVQIEKLGRSTGISFQLLDDLTELTEKSELQGHEENVNPWPMAKRFQDCLETCVENLEIIATLLKKHDLTKGYTAQALSYYFHNTQKKIHANRNNINSKLPQGKAAERDLGPLMTVLNRLCEV